MKAEIHPSYHPITVTCTCGETFQTGSTRDKPLHIEVCSKCHPFYTRKQKVIDTAGRVDKFQKRFARRNAAISADKGKDESTTH